MQSPACTRVLAVGTGGRPLQRISRLVTLLLLEEAAEGAEPTAPEATVPIDPLLHLAQRLGPQLVGALAALLVLLHRTSTIR